MLIECFLDIIIYILMYKANRLKLKEKVLEIIIIFLYYLLSASMGTALIHISPDLTLKWHCLKGASLSSKMCRMQNPKPFKRLCRHNFLLKLHSGFPSSGDKWIWVPKCIIKLLRAVILILLLFYFLL